MKKKERHGLSYTVEYRIWNAIRNRCRNKNNSNYKDYGGRGIDICNTWFNSFVSFLNDVGNRPTDDMNLDRIDNNKGYFKENIRWVTRAENNRNKRNNRNYTFNGKTQCLKDWATEIGINHSTLVARLDRLKMPFEKAISKKIRNKDNNECNAGHKFTDGSFITTKHGKRRCKECQSVYDKKRKNHEHK